MLYDIRFAFLVLPSTHAWGGPGGVLGPWDDLQKGPVWGHTSAYRPDSFGALLQGLFGQTFSRICPPGGAPGPRRWRLLQFLLGAWATVLPLFLLWSGGLGVSLGGMDGCGGRKRGRQTGNTRKPEKRPFRREID
jgi:hypothetical protein